MTINTNYLSINTDLSLIFANRSGTTMANPVNYLYFDGIEYSDLNNLFEPQLTEPGTSWVLTNYKVKNYLPLWTNVVGTYDLGQIFSTTINEPFTINGGSYSISSTTSGTTTTYNIIINPGTTTIKFNILPDSSFINFQLIGGGGGGGGTWTNFSFPLNINSGAGGGGGGNLLVNNFIVDTSQYTLHVGSGGAGGMPNNGTSSSNATAGQAGQATTINGTSVNCSANGGSGGGRGTSSARAVGGTGGNVNINLLSSGTPFSGNGGNGGQGNNNSNTASGTNGSNSYFYNNQSLNYSPSINFPTYYAPGSLYSPQSITLSNWYSVSGGGGGANSNSSDIFAAYQGGSGRGLGGLNGGNFASDTSSTTYPSFGGGGGGGSITLSGFKGGDGMIVMWFSYTQ